MNTQHTNTTVPNKLSAKVMLHEKTEDLTACICIFRNFIRMIQSNSGSVFSNNLIGLKTKYAKLEMKQIHSSLVLLQSINQSKQII